MEKSVASRTVLLRTSVENADKMLENLGRASELIEELRKIFSGYSESGVRVEENMEVTEIDDSLIESIAEKVAKKLSEKLY